MVLSIALSKRFISGALIELDDSLKSIVSLQAFFLPQVYRPNLETPLISDELLRDIVRDEFNLHLSKEEFDNLKINFLLLEDGLELPFLNHPPENLVYTKLSDIKGYNFAPISMHKQFLIDFEDHLSGEPLNRLLNYDHYVKTLPEQSLVDLESVVLNYNLYKIVDNNNLVFSSTYNPHLDDADLRAHLAKIFNEVVELNSRAKVIELAFDHAFLYAIIFSGLEAAKISIKDALRMNPIKPDVVVFNFSGIKKFKILKNDNDITDQFDLEKVSFHPLNREDKVHIEAASIKSTYENLLGLVIDTRNAKN